MTNQEKKRYLQRYTKLNKAINQRLRERDRLRSLAEKCTSSITGLPRGGASDKETTWIRLAEIEEEINADVDKYVDMRKEIEAAINTVDDITLQTLLRYRYLNGLTWERVAVEMEKTWRWIHRLHSRALEAIKTCDKPL